MGNALKHPCDEEFIRSTRAEASCVRKAGPWVLAATILGSSMAFIDETAVAVALPAVQSSLGATAVGAQWGGLAVLGRMGAAASMWEGAVS